MLFKARRPGEACGVSNICVSPVEVTKPPGGYLREENPSRGNSRWTCPEWDPCWPSDPLSLWPLDREREQSDLILQNHSAFSHPNISNEHLTRGYLSHAHTRFHKYIYLQRDRSLALCSAPGCTGGRSVPLGSAQQGWQHLHQRARPSQAWARQGLELSATFNSTDLGIISDNMRVLQRNSS